MTHIAAPKPKAERRRRNVPIRGEWKSTPGVGWQHGPIPAPPAGLSPTALEAWDVWMRSWVAAHWEPMDLAGLRTTIRLYDACESYFENPYTQRETKRGEAIQVLKPNPTTDLRQMMDMYGITPKGQQDRRWVAPKDQPKPAAEKEAGSGYGALKVVE